jgi:hypothetical protein
MDRQKSVWLGATAAALMVLASACDGTIRAVSLGADAAPGPVRSQSQQDRSQFAKKLSRVQSGDSKEKVTRLLGKPQDVRRAPDPVPYPTDEIWCYGADGHGSLATLGEVCFREGTVIWVAGGHGNPPSHRTIDERELCSAMRFLHPGPEHAGYNDPLHLVRVANYLQPLGKDKALATIGEYCRIHDVAVDETWLFLLLRTLFDVPQPPGHMPELLIGAMSPPPPSDRTCIPRFPIVIVDDIPFSLLWGVQLGGQAEPAIRHVEYFHKHGEIRARQFRPPDDPYPSFKRLLASKEWAQVLAAEPSGASNYAGHTLLQLLAFGRTAYDPPEARQPFAYPKAIDYDRYHKEFLETGARWHEKLQMYVRPSGAHGEVGHLRNIYDRPK